MSVLAGWSRTDITPPLGSRLRGYYHERLADGVHDPLHAKALWLADGEEAVALVALDLCSGDARVTAAARERVTALGLPPERLILHATHTHLGPFAGEHVEMLAERIAAAVAAAKAAAGPVTARIGRGHEESVAFCRRFLMRDGSVRFNPGRQNPEIVRPTAPIDPRVEVLVLRPEDGGAPCVVVNFALHLDTIGGTCMSADWPHYLERVLRQVHGEELDCLFLQGCAGDINHIDVSRAEQPKGFAQAEEIGTVLGAEVLKVMARARPAELAPLRFGRELLEVALERPTETELAAARAVYEGGKVTFGRELVAARRTLRCHELGPVYRHEVTALRLGEVSLAAFPGEMFCAYGRRIRDEAPGSLVLTLELCHDDVGYVPTPEELWRGGYESWSSLFPAETGHRVTESALAVLRGLHG